MMSHLLCAEEKKDSTPWGDRRPKDSEVATEMKDSEVVLERYVGLGEVWGLW